MMEAATEIHWHSGKDLSLRDLGERKHFNMATRLPLLCVTWSAHRQGKLFCWQLAITLLKRISVFNV